MGLSRWHTILRLLSVICVLAAVTATPWTNSAAQFRPPLGFGGGIQERGTPEVDIKLTMSGNGPGARAVLNITVVLPPGTYTYSMAPTFGGRTRVDIDKTVGLEPLGKTFQPDHPPKAAFDPLLSQAIEKFVDRVTWSRSYRIRPDTRPDQIAITGTFRYQVCDATSCRPLREAFHVTLAGNSGANAARSPEPGKPAVHPFDIEKRPVRKLGERQQAEPVAWRFKLSPATAKPGDEVTLAITASLDKPWHTFALNHNPKNAGKPIRIDIDRTNNLQSVDEGFRPDRPPEIHIFDGLEQKIHHGTVTWSRRFRRLLNTDSDSFGVTGKISYQICDPHSCRPAKIDFVLGTIGPATDVEALPMPASDLKDANHSTLFDRIAFVEADTSPSSSQDSLRLYLLYAFLGGLILNVMPCVLPVIAIKAMSFVQQAGESRGRILSLNLVYSAGVISVFLVLASLAAFAQLGWGGLFQHPGFNLVMACVVFAMGLSLLGVYEIPVPGFAGGSVGTQQREGLLGAFLTGILATVLATPCSGPFLGTTLGWSVRQPTAVIYLVWGVMGLGMASPYVLFGLFPAAVKWLPRPGMWMIRLKEFAGLVLMGTVVFILSFLDRSLTIPLLIMLLGIALGLWMIGKLYDINSSSSRKGFVRVTALVVTVAVCVFGYGLRNPGVTLSWQAFTEDGLEEAVAANQTVLVDFTADW